MRSHKHVWGDIKNPDTTALEGLEELEGEFDDHVTDHPIPTTRDDRNLAYSTVDGVDLDLLNQTGVYGVSNAINYPGFRTHGTLTTLWVDGTPDYITQEWLSQELAYIRRFQTGVGWSAWEKLLIASDSINYSTSSGYATNSGAVQNMTQFETNTTGNRFLWCSNANGVTEIGRYLDFHTTNSTADYDIRLDCTNSSKMTLFGGSLVVGGVTMTGTNGWTYHTGATGWYNSTYATGMYASAAGVVQNYGQAKMLFLRNVGANSQYNYGTLELQATDAGDVALGFHRGGYSACNLKHESNGLILTGTSNTASANFYATGTVSGGSDIKIKTDILPIVDALDKVKELNGITYSLLDDPDADRMTGLIAQEVQEVLPEAVLDSSIGLTVGYGNMQGLIVEAIKELEERLTAIEERLDGV